MSGIRECAISPKIVDQEAYARKAGIEGVRVSPHTLRHTFAVLYIRNGGDSFSLQEILGHSTPEMTPRYVHLALRDVAEQHKKFSPMERLFADSPNPNQPRHFSP
jgi:integrase/recombinase XerD